MDLIRILERRQRAEAPGQVLLRGGGDSQCAKAVVASEVEILEQRQARGLVDEADHPFPPAIRPSVVDRADGQTFFRWQELLADERKVLAERKPAP